MKRLAIEPRRPSAPLLAGSESRLAIVVCLAHLVARADADPPAKPTVVVRIENGDGDSAKLARALEAAMLSASRDRYLQKPTAEEVQAAADATDCRLVEPSCATSFGARLAVDYILAGEVETHGKHKIAVLSLVNVKSRQRVRSLRDATATAADTARWARAMYDRLVATAVGELTVVANAQRGDVILDGQLVAALFEGRTTISGLALGTHQLGIRAKGFKPIDVDITVDGSNKEMLLLEPLPTP